MSELRAVQHADSSSYASDEGVEPVPNRARPLPCHRAASTDAPPRVLPSSERELVVSRLIAAPRERVFRAWTTRLPEWWGPHGIVTPSCEIDLRPGGAFRTLMRAPDGTEYSTRGVFLEVRPPERIVFTDAYEPGWEPHPGIFFTAIVTFDEADGGRTRCTARALHWNAAARERHERMGFHQCWGESLERLAAIAMLA